MATFLLFLFLWPMLFSSHIRDFTSTPSLPLLSIGPGIIGNYHIVSQTTSSISLNWTPPPGEVFMYRLEWHSGGALMTRHINDNSTVLSELISGTEYTVTVTAVAGDNETEGDPRTFTSATSNIYIFEFQ